MEDSNQTPTTPSPDTVKRRRYHKVFVVWAMVAAFLASTAGILASTWKIIDDGGSILNTARSGFHVITDWWSPSEPVGVLINEVGILQDTKTTLERLTVFSHQYGLDLLQLTGCNGEFAGEDAEHWRPEYVEGLRIARLGEKLVVASNYRRSGCLTVIDIGSPSRYSRYPSGSATGEIYRLHTHSSPAENAIPVLEATIEVSSGTGTRLIASHFLWLYEGRLHQAVLPVYEHNTGWNAFQNAMVVFIFRHELKQTGSGFSITRIGQLRVCGALDNDREEAHLAGNENGDDPVDPFVAKYTTDCDGPIIAVRTIKDAECYSMDPSSGELVHDAGRNSIDEYLSKVYGDYGDPKGDWFRSPPSVENALPCKVP